jgi:hypothetical protein
MCVLREKHLKRTNKVKHITKDVNINSLFFFYELVSWIRKVILKENIKKINKRESKTKNTTPVESNDAAMNDSIA